MKELAVNMLISNLVIKTKMGQPLTIVELMHTQTVNTLYCIRFALGKQIESIEQQDEWVSTSYQQEKLDNLKTQKELVNLIIGWKKYKAEQLETMQKKAELTEQLKQLKESQKTPEDRIRELEAELISIDSEEL